MSPLEIVQHYHERTKHYPHRFARSLGYLDWSTQPDPFRRYAGASLIPLPRLTSDDSPEYERLFASPSITPQPVTARTLSRFFECSLAISAWKELKGSRWALRVNPSSGNLHPTEGYVILRPIDGWISQGGVFHYASREHSLERRCTFPAEVDLKLPPVLGEALFLCGLSSIYWREAWKYGERAFRYCQHDIGHALGAVRVSAAALGWRVWLYPEMSDGSIETLLGLNRVGDYDGAEVEHADLLVAVVPNDASPGALPDLPDEFISTVKQCTWHGQANPLSQGHVPWEAIDWVHEATYRSQAAPGTEMQLEARADPDLSSSGRQTVASDRVAAPSAGPLELPVHRTPSDEQPPSDSRSDSERRGLPTARHIIRTRRSAVDFDGRTSIDSDRFFKILSLVVPQPNDLQSTYELRGQRFSHARTSAPFDLWSWSPRIHLFLFVHRVQDLPSGLYALIRDASQLDRVRAATRSEFAWSPPHSCPAGLPLHFLMEADCRRAAKTLSLNQDIAGDGAFSLGMVADFRRSLAEYGPWFYKRLFWEAGYVGQLLYLQAEAAGIRATGIGAYFDDPVHEVFGFSGDDFQSLYHFTLGGPVEDRRLTTLPAYPWEIPGNG